MTFKTSLEYSVTPVLETHYSQGGGVAQMVERSLSMREVPGSIPGASTVLSGFLLKYFSKTDQKDCIVRESNPGRPRGRRAFYH